MEHCILTTAQQQEKDDLEKTCDQLFPAPQAALGKGLKTAKELAIVVCDLLLVVGLLAVCLDIQIL